MMHKSPQHDTMNPPGQIVNLEVPLTRAISAFADEQMHGLALRVLQLEKELKYVRSENLRLFSELEQAKQDHHWATVSQQFWFNAAKEAGWVSDQA